MADALVRQERGLFADALAEYGEDAQIEQTVEECAELIQAIYGDDRDAVIDELADVRIMVAQLSLLVGEGEVASRIEYKMDRLRDRLDGETDG